jgi:hypothetical protein
VIRWPSILVWLAILAMIAAIFAELPNGAI